MKVLRAILAAGLLVLDSSPGFSGEHVGKRQDPIKAPCIPNKNYLKPAEEQPEQPAEEQPEQPPKETPEQPATVLRKMKPTSKERASSSWTVCNRLGKGPVEVAYIVKIDGNWHHKGWRSIPVGQCELLQEKLETDTVYFHARGQGFHWAGRNEYCGRDNKMFDIAFANLKTRKCPPGYSNLPFIRLGVGNGGGVTTTLLRDGHYRSEPGG
jgi:uncharacterized membrane protein